MTSDRFSNYANELIVVPLGVSELKKRQSRQSKPMKIKITSSISTIFVTKNIFTVLTTYEIVSCSMIPTPAIIIVDTH